ncbi:MAG: fibrillarin-like pre-rRNA processing protein [Thermoplasmata archaeon]|jgi:fibrillarin-like pre-rRNA processing protein|nr:fibrillarin-like pre-rRNA processing protein [Thermoplasmata archaeon]
MARELLPNVIAFDDGRILSRSLVPGQRVYDEELHTVEGAEFRTWNPTKSKLGAYLVKGGRAVELRANSTIVYLGAANGTTPSHVSDIVREGTMVAVEFSPRSFRDLLRMSEPRANIVPVLADAWRPELYERYVGHVDFLFQDIAQRQQAAIFAKNIEAFKPDVAMIAVKARSVNVAAHPREVYEQVAREVEERSGYEVVDSIDLGPFERDHAALVLRPGTGRKRPQPQPQQERREERPRYEQRRDERPRQQGGFQKREGGGGGGFRPREDKRGPPPGKGKWQPREDRAPPPRDDRRPGGDFGNRRGWR